MSPIYVGMSGFTFPGWKGSFYPPDLPAKDELKYACTKLTSLEINATFYRYQTPTIFRKWYGVSPQGFKFAVKAPRVITHQRRLKEVDQSLCNFLASGVLALGEKLGPILWQFPPHLPLKDGRFEEFFRKLPKSQLAAAAWAKRHSEQMTGKVFCDPHDDYPLLHAFEFRHPSFQNKDFLAMMREMGHSLVFAHSPEAPAFYLEELMGEHVYLRLHGNEPAFAKGYPPKVLDWLAERVQAWSQGLPAQEELRILDQEPVRVPRQVFVYFDNQEKESAPGDACRFLEKLAAVAANPGQASRRLKKAIA